MIELYHCRDARSFRALWALEELELDYRLHILPFPPRIREPSFLELNPLGTVPLLIDGEAIMTESAAMLQYFAAHYGPTPLAVEPGMPDYAAWLNWLHFGEATLTFPQTIVLRYRHLETQERRLPQAADDYAQWFLARLRAVDRALAESQYLCADRFTIADISVGYALLLARNLGFHDGLSTRVTDYWGRLSERRAYQSARDRQRSASADQIPATLQVSRGQGLTRR